jgi:hypothetical protein
MNSEIELENVDPEDIEDLLKKVEKSFDIKFVPNELAYVTNFGQLCDHIIDKIKIEETDGCTSQQAFYKLQDALSEVLYLEKKQITPQAQLQKFLVRDTRRKVVNQLEKRLGFKISILQPPGWLTLILIVALFVSFFSIFWNWKLGILGFALSVIAVMLANKFGKELDLKTVGDVAKKMSHEHYLQSRRNSKTVNKKELEQLLTAWFKNDLVLDKLNRESALNK